MFSVLSLNVSAADDGAINTRDLDFSASVQVETSDGTSTVQHDVTDDITVDTTSAEVVKGFVRYTFPSSKDYDTKRTLASLVVFNGSKLNSSHEYNLKFDYAFNKPLPFYCAVSLRFYDNSGSVLRTQNLFQGIHLSDQNNMKHSVDIDFKLDSDGLNSGYKCELVIVFSQDGYNSSDVQRFYVSPEIYLTDKDDDSGWFQKIIDGIKEIPEKLGDLGDSISDFFDGLGDRISDFFVDLRDNLSAKFEAVGTAITDKFSEIGEDFSARFEKFKPRIYEDLKWVNKSVNSSTGELVDKPPAIVKKRAVTSTLFYVSSGTVYNFEYALLESWSMSIFYYTDDGEFIDTYYSVSSTGGRSGELVLPSGYSYRFMIVTTDDLSVISSSVLSDYFNSYVKLYADEGWLTAFGRMILAGLQALFIPDDDYFSSVSEEMQQWGAEHFGFLWELSDLMYVTIDNLQGLLKDGYVFILPAAEFDLNGEHYVLWDEYEVPVGQYIENVAALKYAYNTYLIVIAGICGVALFNYGRKTFDKVTSN